jgi:hypothetical protein
MLVKYVAYAAWCYIGLGLLDPERHPSAARALGYGLARLALGFGFGMVIFVLAMVLSPHTRLESLVTYLAAYVPVRCLEWAIMDRLLSPPSSPGFLLGRDRASRRWRLGGVAVSCAADIPLIIAMGGVIPVGRIFC